MKCTSFRQNFTLTALKILAVRKYTCGFLPCLHKILLENPHKHFVRTHSEAYSETNWNAIKPIRLEWRIQHYVVDSCFYGSSGQAHHRADAPISLSGRQSAGNHSSGTAEKLSGDLSGRVPHHCLHRHQRQDQRHQFHRAPLSERGQQHHHQSGGQQSGHRYLLPAAEALHHDWIATARSKR